ncbi:hypothetical protein S40285_05235 [Stachybotrys chlorohalonatus IBT 40285]|uniref:Uncharacterized protein n=1 Tax=Stachybotrys chlorohalonatus (strain IBT 40285) TaxID=1283841 RepID=A0A084QTA1_STAC4|nr:hypothetical protein S40285_05235 [Stachybotrys chlorohalonata IBT 40285]
MQRRTQRPLDLLGNPRFFQATDPRDKVFGLYSLFSESDLARLTLRPNYDMDVVDVYAQAVIDCIALEGNLDVLGFAGAGDDEAASRDLPSWVPDWTSRIELSPYYLGFYINSPSGTMPGWRHGGQLQGVVILPWKSPRTASRYHYRGASWDRVVETGGVLEKE